MLVAQWKKDEQGKLYCVWVNTQTKRQVEDNVSEQYKGWVSL